MSILELKNIRKSFDNKVVLDGIDLTVDQGEVVSILGPSGSGKSTLLRCATFLETADGGSIAYKDRKVVKMDEQGNTLYGSKADIRWASGQFGLVFQNFNLFPHFNVLKNVSDAPIINQKRKKEEVYEEVRTLLKKVGLEGREEAYPCELSGGQQQRVAIARALAMKPSMLYFDEPTLYAENVFPFTAITAEILRLLKQLAAEKMTMVIVTHEIDFARAVSDRVVFMDEGVVVETGTPEEVIDHPKNERTKAFLKKLHV